jgi:hypothetical protein
MRKPRRTAETVRNQGAALAPVWIEADELREFKSWWDRLSDRERNARRAFLHGLERADSAWAVVYERQAAELLQARESLRVAEKDLAGIRTANERLRRELEGAVDRAADAEERVRQLTTPIAREYE